MNRKDSRTANENPRFLGQEIMRLDRQGLRKFGWTFSTIIAALFGLILPLIFGWTLPIWPWIFALALSVISLTVPPAVNLLYQIWMRFGVIMNIIMNRIILGILFFFLILPIGIILRSGNIKRLGLKTDPEMTSYRKESLPLKAKQMERPF